MMQHPLLSSFINFMYLHYCFFLTYVIALLLGIIIYMYQTESQQK